MQRRKRARVNVTTFTDWNFTTPSQPSPPPPVIHRHTDYSVNRGTGISASRSYYVINPNLTASNETAANDDNAGLPEDADDVRFHRILTEEEAENAGLHRILTDEEEDDTVSIIPKTTRKRTAGDQPMLVWMQERDTFLREFLRLEGRETPDVQCPTPECDSEALFRCPQCFDLRLFCQECVVMRHQALPLHQLEMWNSRFFERRTLCSLGLRVQVGHPLGETCSNPVPAFNDDFIVISSHGIIPICLDYCECMKTVERSVQLLRARLFPATTVDPKTAATFEVLRLFQLLTFGSKVSGYEFYQSLVRLRNNLGEAVPDRYLAFMRIVRQWRHIRLLKRAGRGHEAGGVLGTPEGACAVLCPACPQPSKNLPSDWQAAAESKRWIYSLFLAIDANFRLKRLAASSDIRDPGLNRGYAYFVEEKKYKEFLMMTTDLIPEEASTCNNYDAVKLASIRGGKGTTASGVGTIECSRHDMKRPLSVGDLQKGERYANMDYLYFSSLRNHAPNMVVTSYDIACQWGRKLQARAAAYPNSLVGLEFNKLSITYLVPKFHLYAHRNDCQINYSFNLTPNVGRTDGESPERGWAAMNPVASSTKEMGPGSRRDTLDDHFGDYNWRKVISFHTSLLRKVQEAVEMRSEHVSAFLEFSNSLPTETTKTFSELVWAWEADPTTTNPYQATLETVSQAKIRLELAEEEAAAITREENLPAHDSVSPSVFIAQGLELQEQQARLRLDASALGVHATDHQQTQVTERRNRLARRIVTWRAVQDLYMPGVAALRLANPETGGTLAEATPLQLPSEVEASVLRNNTTLADYEWRLRYGQAFDALAELRRQLLVISSMYQSKDRYMRGQSLNTRSVALVKKVQSRANFAATTYRIARTALLTLGAILRKSGWESTLRPLADTDIRSLKDGEDASSSEGRRTLSWIWTTQRTVDAEMTADMNEALRIEWCKARARAQRWQEECILLDEEMRRVQQFHSWQAGVWQNRALEARSEGVRAYAWRQEATREKLLSMCRSAWVDVAAYIKIGEGAVVAGEALVESYRRPNNTSDVPA